MRETEIIFFFFLQYCYSAILHVLQKNLQYLGLAFLDAEHFGAWNAKFSLHLVLAFPYADAQEKLEALK